MEYITNNVFIYCIVSFFLPVYLYSLLGKAYVRLSQPQFLVESVRLGLPAQKLGQRLHLVLAAALLQDNVAVPTALLAVHRVGLEYRVKHVC